MFVISHRKLSKLVNFNDRDINSIKIHRGSNCIKVTTEKYKDVIGVQMELYCVRYSDVVEFQFRDIVDSGNRLINIDRLSQILNRMYEMSVVGLYVREGIWANSMPKFVVEEDIYEYFGCSSDDIRNAKKSIYKYNKMRIEVVGEYFGKKVITFLCSNRTGYVDNIKSIEEIV